MANRVYLDNFFTPMDRHYMDFILANGDYLDHFCKPVAGCNLDMFLANDFALGALEGHVDVGCCCWEPHSTMVALGSYVGFACSLESGICEIYSQIMISQLDIIIISFCCKYHTAVTLLT